MRQTWRWFGPDDPVTLDNAKQAGAQGVVTALHHLYDGRAWRIDDVVMRRRAVEAAGLTWDVCESIPVPDAIKLRAGPHRQAIEAWKDSLVSLARSGVTTICYNFMPVVDWTRTDLRYPTAAKGLALRFDMPAFIAYDAFVLRRAGAEADYPAAALAAAREALAKLDAPAFALIEKNVIGGLPARQAEYTRAQFAEALNAFDGLTAADLRANLIAFLAEIAPLAEELGARLALHPDDPPFSLFGLPRVVSTAADYRALFAAVASPANGITLCAGSLGSRADNDLVAMAERIWTARAFRPSAQRRARARWLIRRVRASRGRRRHGGFDRSLAARRGASPPRRARRPRDSDAPRPRPFARRRCRQGANQSRLFAHWAIEGARRTARRDAHVRMARRTLKTSQ